MAERRMFAKNIVDSDMFLDMPATAQALYFHLAIRADDDGFIDNPKKIQRVIGVSNDDLKLLQAKQFIIPFESGVVVIRHWKIHNYIRQDRKKNTDYTAELAMLDESANGAYCLAATKCQPIDNQMSVKCQHRLGKDSIGKDRLDKDNINILPEQPQILDVEVLDAPPTTSKKRKKTYRNGLDNPDKIQYADSVALTPVEYKKLVDKHGETKTHNMLEWFSSKKISRGYIYASDYHALLNWGISEYENAIKTKRNSPAQSINDISNDLLAMMGD